MSGRFFLYRLKFLQFIFNTGISYHYASTRMNRTHRMVYAVFLARSTEKDITEFFEKTLVVRLFRPFL